LEKSTELDVEMPSRGEKMSRILLVVFTASVLLLGVARAWGHHSHGNFITTEYILLQGTVREMHWMNPHTWIYLEVSDDDSQPVLWVLEGASPVELVRSGWNQDSVQVGDAISVRCHQLRDGSNGCLLGFLTPEGGSEKEWD
jgi:hypothetical protein